MAHHEPCGPHETFVGNTQRYGGNLTFLTNKGLKTARVGGVAFDIEGKPLPDYYAPLFINMNEADRYNSIMMERTFGPNWRRG